ncbi:hypothetical protein SO802_028102 [Lithocarpus litseifolius]|uniref:Uncharacterized protein n=1 Tax=Lithocarpus litseifolius TaxID=425828 RepID=A0AAW2BQD2_9ROSI
MQKQSPLTETHGTLLRPRFNNTHPNRHGPPRQPISPIHRPPFLSTRQLGFIVFSTLIWIPFAIKKIVKGKTLLQDPKLLLANSVFVYFFSVSGAMHSIEIREMLLWGSKED